MRYVAAYLLCVLGGKSNPCKEDITKILESIGLDIEDDRLDKVISELNGKDINEVIAEGSSKLAQMPSGGGVAASSGGASGGGGADAAEEKKEEAKAEESDESDDDMGFGLFD